MNKRGPEDDEVNAECGVSGERVGLADYAARSGPGDPQGKTLAIK